MNQDSLEKPLTLREILLYNTASIPLNLYDTVLMAWVMYFYIPPQDLGRIQYTSMAAIGIILAGGRVLDAITDPLVGYLSDHFRSRWGRRKPFIFVSLPVLFASFVMVWAPPIKGDAVLNAVFLAVVLFFYYWAYTGVLIPWFAMLPEMSQKNTDRVKISTIGVAIGVVGALVGGGLSGPLMENIGVLSMAVILGLFAFLSGEIALLGMHERHRPGDAEASVGLREFFRVLKQVFADRQVLSFSAMIILAQMTYQLMLMNVPYFTTLVLGKKESDASMLMGQVIIVMAFSTPLWYWLLSHFPKRKVFRFILVFMAAGYFAAFFIGSYPLFSPYVQAVIVFTILIIPYGGMFATVLGIIADITDYDELKYGKRREAVYYGIYGIVRKTGWAFCSLIIAGTFSFFGYSVENPMGVRVIWLVCAAACLLAFLFYFPYKLGDSKEETRKIMSMRA